MSKDCERYPVYFITEDVHCALAWKANPEGDPILLATVEKKGWTLKKTPAFVDEPDENFRLFSDMGAKLDQLISHGLASASTSPSPWTQFLTQGLYDPRLFAFFIRPFLAEPSVE